MVGWQATLNDVAHQLVETQGTWNEAQWEHAFDILFRQQHEALTDDILLLVCGDPVDVVARRRGAESGVLQKVHWRESVLLNVVVHTDFQLIVSTFDEDQVELLHLKTEDRVNVHGWPFKFGQSNTQYPYICFSAPQGLTSAVALEHKFTRCFCVGLYMNGQPWTSGKRHEAVFEGFVRHAHIVSQRQSRWFHFFRRGKSQRMELSLRGPEQFSTGLLRVVVSFHDQKSGAIATGSLQLDVLMIPLETLARQLATVVLFK